MNNLREKKEDKLADLAGDVSFIHAGLPID